MSSLSVFSFCCWVLGFFPILMAISPPFFFISGKNKPFLPFLFDRHSDSNRHSFFLSDADLVTQPNFTIFTCLYFLCIPILLLFYFIFFCSWVVFCFCFCFFFKCFYFSVFAWRCRSILIVQFCDRQRIKSSKFESNEWHEWKPKLEYLTFQQWLRS